MDFVINYQSEFFGFYQHIAIEYRTPLPISEYGDGDYKQYNHALKFFEIINGFKKECKTGEACDNEYKSCEHISIADWYAGVLARHEPNQEKNLKPRLAKAFEE